MATHSEEDDMKYIKEWLAEPTTATQYLIDGDIDWDVVPQDDMEKMIFSVLHDADANEYLCDIMLYHSDPEVLRGCIHKLITNKADTLTYSVIFRGEMREAVLSFIRDVATREIGIAETALAIYGHEYETTEQAMHRIRDDLNEQEYLR
jgi:hypothetical protein